MAENEAESPTLDEAEVQAAQELAETQEEPEAEIEEESKPEPAKAPDIVEKHSPGMAGVWNKLTRTQQSKLMEDIARQLDARHPDSERDDGDAAKADAESRPGTETERVGGLPAPPEALTEAEIQALVEYFGDDDSSAGRAFRRLIDRDTQQAAYNKQVSQVLNDALTEVRTDLGAVGLERDIEKALITNDSHIGEVSKEQYEEIADKAMQFVVDGKVSDASYAVILAALEVRGEPAQPTQDQGDKNRRAKQAGSYAKPPRQPVPTQGRAPDDLDDAIEMAKKEIATGN